MTTQITPSASTALDTTGLPSFSMTLTTTVDAAPRSAESMSSAASMDLTEYMGMVRAVARRIHRTLPSHIEISDLISAGYLGLVDAAQKFEHAKGANFRAYAEFRVRGAILDSLRELDWGTRSLRRKSREIEEARRSLASSLGHEPEDSLVAGRLGMSLNELRQIANEVRSTSVSSLQAEREEDEGQDLLATLVDTTAIDALTLCLDAEFKQILTEAIEALPERERLVVTLSFYEELTLKEIGELMNVTLSRVSQLRSAAIKRLRTALQAGSQKAEQKAA